jgi:pyridoxamine 5'-phosphate oxidase
MSDRILDEGDVDPDPFEQFSRWFAQAAAAGVLEPEAMCVATAVDGVPSARMVLLKSVDHRGFVFFTNYASQKGREAKANPVAALVWRWFAVERQVRVTGAVERVSPEESDSYFATRPRAAQLATWASPQSSMIVDRAALDARMASAQARFDGVADVPRPPWWGGLRVTPSSIEFWQGRPNRLHDRLRYLRDPDQGWRIERLAP